MILTKKLNIFKKENHLSWQAEKNNSASKVKIIKPILTSLGCTSVLDVGCNAGEVTRLLGNDYFAVGLDQNIDFKGFEQPLRNACLGEIQLSFKTAEKIPTFDAVCLFSVHHQWHFYNGDDFAKKMVKFISRKAKKVFFIEFAAINSKYSESGVSLFEDNNENSVIDYATKWLQSVLPQHNIQHVGKVAESNIEPFRFMFACMP